MLETSASMTYCNNNSLLLEEDSGNWNINAVQATIFNNMSCSNAKYLLLSNETCT